MSILITGANGQLGQALVTHLQALGPIHALSRTELDLGVPEDIREKVRLLAPRVILNTGAYTAVDKAESESDLAHQINAESPAHLALAAREVNATLLHFSTDYVFDGQGTRPYREDDIPAPINVYGRTKLAGEIAALAAWEKTTVFRVSWLYDTKNANFLSTMLRLAQSHRELRVVDDQKGAPTWTEAIAKALTPLVRGDLQKKERPHGLFHLPSGGETTWFGFAQAIFERAQTGTCVHPIPSSEYPTPAARPEYSVMDGEKAERSLNLTLDSWSEQFNEAWREFKDFKTR